MIEKIEQKINELKELRDAYADIMQQQDGEAFGFNRVQYLDCVSKIVVLSELLESE